MAGSSIKKLPGKSLTIAELLTNSFTVKIQDEKYQYQFKYRHKSIAYIFLKEFTCALGLVIIFQYINFKYLSLFAERKFKNLPTTQ